MPIIAIYTYVCDDCGKTTTREKEVSYYRAEAPVRLLKNWEYENNIIENARFLCPECVEKYKGNKKYKDFLNTKEKILHELKKVQHQKDKMFDTFTNESAEEIEKIRLEAEENIAVYDENIQYLKNKIK